MKIEEKEVRVHFEDYPYEVDKSRLKIPLSKRPTPEEVAAHARMGGAKLVKEYALVHKRKKSLHSRTLKEWKQFEIKRLNKFKLELKNIYERMYFIEDEMQKREERYKDSSKAVNLYFIHLGGELREKRSRARKLEKYLSKITKKKIEDKWNELIKKQEENQKE